MEATASYYSYLASSTFLLMVFTLLGVYSPTRVYRPPQTQHYDLMFLHNKSLQQDSAHFETCFLKEALFDGTWKHLPNVSRPEIMYFLKNNKWGIEGEAFRKQHPLDDKAHLPYNQWDWVPDSPSCGLYPFDKRVMCALLKRHLKAKHMLFVGDSITEQQALSFLLLMGGPPLHNW